MRGGRDFSLIHYSKDDALTFFETRSGNIQQRRLDHPPGGSMIQHPNLVFPRLAPRPHCRGTSHSNSVALQNSCDRPNRTGIASSETNIVPAVGITSRSSDPLT